MEKMLKYIKNWSVMVHKLKTNNIVVLSVYFFEKLKQ